MGICAAPDLPPYDTILRVGNSAWKELEPTDKTVEFNYLIILDFDGKVGKLKVVDNQFVLEGMTPNEFAKYFSIAIASQ